MRQGWAVALLGAASLMACSEDPTYNQGASSAQADDDSDVVEDTAQADMGDADVGLDQSDEPPDMPDDSLCQVCLPDGRRCAEGGGAVEICVREGSCTDWAVESVCLGGDMCGEVVWQLVCVRAECQNGAFDGPYSGPPEGLAGFTSVRGDVELSPGQEGLKPLSCLQSIDGSLSIRNNDTLASLEGLESLGRVDRLVLADLDNLRSLDGLGPIGPRLDELIIDHNDRLGSVAALANVTRVEGSVSLFDNGGLQNLVGLQNLTYVGQDLIIERNEQLSSLGVLEELRVVHSLLRVSFHPELCQEEVEALVDRLEEVGEVGSLGNTGLCRE